MSGGTSDQASYCWRCGNECETQWAEIRSFGSPRVELLKVESRCLDDRCAGRFDALADTAPSPASGGTSGESPNDWRRQCVRAVSEVMDAAPAWREWFAAQLDLLDLEYDPAWWVTYGRPRWWRD